MKRVLLSFSLLLALVGRAQSPIDVQHYRFELELSNSSDVISGKATVKVKFLQPASQLRLDLTAPDDQESGSTGMRVFLVEENKQMLRQTQSGETLTILLSTPAKEGEERTFIISYMGAPKDGLIISKNKFGDRTFFGDNWPNRAHHWLPVNDRPDDKASFEFLVTAPSEYKVISNGLQQKPQVQSGKTTWHYREETPLSTKIMVIGAARFAVTHYKDSPKDIPVSAWAYQQDSAKIAAEYAAAPAILNYFSSYIAPFPYKKLANVQSTTIFGGMENAGSIFYDEKGVRESTVAHEIAHQWFGDMASEKSFAHLWLSEGFATYFEHLWTLKSKGNAAFFEELENDRKAIIAFSRAEDRPVVDSTSDLMSLLNANSYQKGGWVLRMIHAEVGDSTFQKIVRAYYNRFKGSNADTRDFQKVVEEVSGKSWRIFFDQWLYRPDLPQLDIQWVKKGNASALIIIQKQKDLYRLALPYSSVHDQGRILRHGSAEISERITTIPIAEGVDNLSIGSGYQVLYEGPIGKLSLK